MNNHQRYCHNLRSCPSSLYSDAAKEARLASRSINVSDVIFFPLPLPFVFPKKNTPDRRLVLPYITVAYAAKTGSEFSCPSAGSLSLKGCWISPPKTNTSLQRTLFDRVLGDSGEDANRPTALLLQGSDLWQPDTFLQDCSPHKMMFVDKHQRPTALASFKDGIFPSISFSWIVVGSLTLCAFSIYQEIPKIPVGM